MIPGSGRSPGEGNGNPLQYSCLEKPHGLRSLVDYSPWDRKESDTTEQLHFHFSPGGARGKASACQFRTGKKCEFDAWVRNILWRRNYQTTTLQYFLPGEFHEQRNLIGYSSWGRKSLTGLRVHTQTEIDGSGSCFQIYYSRQSK